MSRLAMCSSDEVIKALEHTGFRAARAASGSHWACLRSEPDGTTRVVTVVPAKREVPRGTLRDIPRQVGNNHQAAALSPLPPARVEGVAQAVADEVDRDGGQEH